MGAAIFMLSFHPVNPFYILEVIESRANMMKPVSTVSTKLSDLGINISAGKAVCKQTNCLFVNGIPPFTMHLTANTTRQSKSNYYAFYDHAK